MIVYGLQVSALGFGCMGLDFSYGHKLSREEGVTLIRQAVDGRSSAVSRFCEAESEVARLKVQVQKKWFAAKLETSRVAAEVKLRNRNADVQAAANKMFDEKMAASETAAAA